jgi:hypothetical protein
MNERKLVLRLAAISRTFLPTVDRPEMSREMNAALGKMEFEITRTFTFFDTLLDILSQRSSQKLGEILAGADVIAMDGLQKNHPALKVVESPIVYFDRGFGASILRTGVPIPGGIYNNEIPLIQLPYERITDKCALSVGILHESAHEALDRLHIVKEFPAKLYNRLIEVNAHPGIAQVLSLWTREIGPDFWGFLCSGIAQTSSIKDILSLSPQDVFRVSANDPHPAPWLRVLLSISWAKRAWGESTLFEMWEKDWLNAYPLELAPSKMQKLLRMLQSYFGIINDILFEGKFSALNGKTLSSLFNLDALSPIRLEQKALTFLERGRISLRRTSSPSEHVAVFAFLREKGMLSEEALDRIMTQWFIKLSNSRNHELVLAKR